MLHKLPSSSLLQPLRALFADRKYRVPRIWSNHELKRFAALFHGDVVNVSAWRDEDKEGSRYCQYFVNAKSYSLTNYREEARGFQGTPGEMFLDLTAPLASSLQGKFDVVFNHTVMEHIYEVHDAFRNLCKLSRDIVIIVVPFLQPMHSKYGDFWRFTPLTLERLFAENELEMLYSSFNRDRLASVYVFAIASRHPDRWRLAIPRQTSHVDSRRPLDGYEPFIGCHAIPNRAHAVGRSLARLARRLAGLLGRS